MAAYDAAAFRPPAPVAMVTVRAPSGASVSNVPMLLDTGADVSLLPRESVATLLDLAQESRRYELESFDGTRSWAPVCQAELCLLGRSFRGQFLVTDGRHGILGRNVLNSLALVFDGPSLVWEERR